MATAERPDLLRPTAGVFSPALLRGLLDQVLEGNAVFALSVSNGREERVFFFTRGAILFLPTGPGGGDVLAARVIAERLADAERVNELAARAKREGGALQDLLVKQREVAPEEMRRVVEDLVAGYLVEIALWDGALYDIAPGNAPPKLYEKGVPALRVSTGVAPLLERVRPQVDEAAAALEAFGGSLSNVLVPSPAGERTQATLEPTTVQFYELLRPGGVVRVKDAIARGSEVGLAPLAAAKALAELVGARRLSVEIDQGARSREQALLEAQAIERAMDEFVNRLLASMHLARLYSGIDEKEKAAGFYRVVAQEQFAREAPEEALTALREVVKAEPRDLEARELIVKVLRSGDRLAEAAKEAVELGRVLIQHGLPGRAKQAFELSLELVPGSQNVLWLLGGLLSRLGYKEDAVKVFEELTERAKETGDVATAVASSEQLVKIAPENPKATGVLGSVPSYRRTILLSRALIGASVLFLLLSVGWGTHEIFALRAFRSTDESVGELLEAHQFDAARERVRSFASTWRLSPHAKNADALLGWVEREEGTVQTVTAAREARAARALEAEGRTPEALEHWKLARGSRDPVLAREVEESIGHCQDRVREGTLGLAEAQMRAGQNMFDAARDMIARTLERAPWLRKGPLMVPIRIESFPKGAKVTLDGEELTRTTPFATERPYAPGTLTVESKGRDPVTIALDPLPPWPIRVVLPRHPDWRLPEIVATTPPLVAGELVIAAARDRSVVAVSRRDGTVRWRASLDLFGECELPLVRLEQTVVARLAVGTLVALDIASGKELWRRDVAPLPLDAPDPRAGRPVPVAAPAGFVVRDGARGITFLDARDGSRRWTLKLRTDPQGVVEVAGERAVLLVDGALASYRLTDGTAFPALALPGKPLGSPVAVGGGLVALELEPDALALVQVSGSNVREPVKVLAVPFTSPLVVDSGKLLAGVRGGEVFELDPDTLQTTRIKIAADETVHWIKPVDGRLTLVGTDVALHALDGRREDAWREPAMADLVGADERRVFLGLPEGLSALER